MKKILLMISIALSSMMVNAQEIAPKEELQGQASESMSAIRLAADLVRYGYANKSSLALVDALQILSENPTQPLRAEKEGDAADETNAEGKKGKVTVDYNKVLADAREFANGDQNLLAVIDNIDADAQGSHRGNVNGPCWDEGAVAARGTYTYQASFIANQLAEILVSGDGDTDLDLYVYDSNGNLIASDTDYTDDCYVRWVPAWTGRFIIKIVNRGPVYNRFVIATN